MPLPHHIQLLRAKFEVEPQSFKKVHRLIDLAEAAIKFHTVVVVSDYMRQRDIAGDVKEMFSAGLKSPSLGTWAYFTLHVHPLLKSSDAFWPSFADYFKKILREGTGRIIEFRNKYAHGSTPSDEDCLKDITQIQPHVDTVLNGGLLGASRIVVYRDGKFDEILSDGTVAEFVSPGDLDRGAPAPGSVWAVNASGRPLNLHPLLTYRHAKGAQTRDPQTERFFYFNDLRGSSGKAVGLLNYDDAIHLRDKALMAEFSKVFPVDQWEKRATSEFRQRIEELTENFKGRRAELADLKNFIRTHERGHYMIWGPPGVGKSTLLARAIQELSWENIDRTDLPPEEQIKGLRTVEYFIRRGARTDTAETYLNLVSAQIESRVKTGVSMGSPAEKVEKYYERLRAASDKLGETKKKMVLFIDGLDEAQDDLVRLLPADSLPNILVFFASRDVSRSRALYRDRLNPETRKETNLSGLSPADIRALLYDYVSKYELASDYVDAIASRSEGNPLYLKLLCQALSEGELKLNDISGLPKEIGTFYDAILKRFAARPDGEKIVDLLYLLAVSLDYMHADTVSAMLGVSRIKADQLLEEAAEVLLENPLTTEYEDWQLFHESLRDYLKTKYTRELHRLEARVLDVCRTWQKLASGSSDVHTLEYVLKYFVSHLIRKIEREEGFVNELPTEGSAYSPKRLADNPLEQELYSLLLKFDFKKTQVEHLQFYSVSLKDAQAAVELAVRHTAGGPGQIVDTADILRTGNLPHLSQLVLYAGELGAQAQSDLSIVALWAREGKVQEALERVLAIKDEQKRFARHFQILWEVVDSAQLDDAKKKECCERVMRHIDETLPPGTDAVDWGRLKMSERVGRVLEAARLVEANVLPFFRRGGAHNQKCLCVEWAELAGGRSNPLARTVLFGAALEAAFSIEDELERADALTGIAGGLFAAGNESKAREILERVLTAGESSGDRFRARALREIAEVLRTAGEFKRRSELLERTLTVADSIVDQEHRVDALSAIVGCLRGEDEERVEERVEESLVRALTAAESLGDDRDKARALRRVAKGLSEVREFQGRRALFNRVLRVAETIEDDQSREDTLSGIAGALVIAGDEQGGDIFERVLAAAESLADEADRMFALRVIANDLRSAKHFEARRDLIERVVLSVDTIKGVVLIAQVLPTVARALIATGEEGRAREILGQLLEAIEGTDDSSWKLQSLVMVADFLATAGRMKGCRGLLEQAIKVAESMEDASDRAYALAAIAGGLSAAGEGERAAEIFGRSLGTEAKYDAASTLSKISGGLAWGLPADRNVVWFARALAEIDPTSMTNPDWVSAHEWMGEVLAGHLEGGRELLDQILTLTDSRPHDRAIALSGLARGLIAAGGMVNAKEVILQSMAAAESVSADDWRLLDTLAGIARGLSAVGEHAKARETFERALREAESSETSVRTGSVMLIARALGHAGEHAKARELFQRVLTESNDYAYFRALALSGIAGGLIAAGDKASAREVFYQAREAAASVRDAALMTKTLSGIASGLSATGDQANANEIFDRAVEATGALNKADSIAALMRLAARLGTWLTTEKVTEVIERALAVAQSIDVAEFRATELSGICADVAQAMSQAATRKCQHQMAHTLEHWRLRAGSQGHQTDQKSVEAWQDALVRRYPPDEDCGDQDIGRVKLDRDRQWLVFAFSYLARSLGWYPLDPETAHNGIECLLTSLAWQGEIESLTAIARACPELGLAEIFADTPSIPESARAEIVELDRLLAEEEITQKVYDRKKAEILAKPQAQA